MVSTHFSPKAIETCSQWGNGGPNVHFKDRRGDEEPLITWVQLSGQPVVTSSRWPLPTLAYCYIVSNLGVLTFLTTRVSNTQSHSYALKSIQISVQMWLQCTSIYSTILNIYYESEPKIPLRMQQWTRLTILGKWVYWER